MTTMDITFERILHRHSAAKVKVGLIKHAISVAADAGAITGPVVFIGVMVLLESLQPQFDPLRQTISALVWGPFGWLQTVVFYLFGLLLILLAAKIRRLVTGRLTAGSAAAALLLVGLGFTVVAICPTRAPDAPATVVSALHEISARAIVVVFPVASLLTSVGLWRCRARKASACALLAGIVGLALIAAGILLFTRNLPYIGLLERAMLVNGLVWLELVGVLLVQAHRRMSVGGTVTSDRTPEAVQRPEMMEVIPPSSLDVALPAMFSR